MPPLACLGVVESPHHNPLRSYGLPGEGSLPVPLVPYFPNPFFANGGGVGTAAAAAWSAAHSSALYRVDGWGAPYFVVNENGNVAVRPHGAKTLPSEEIDVMKVVKKVVASKSVGGLGMSAPLIVRFPDVLKHRLESLQSAFDSAMQTQSYGSFFQGVYPVKCNQDRYVVENIVEFGKPYSFGLEAGSKPELLLAMASMCKASPKALLVCNGYKDEEYVSLALTARRMNFNCVIVLEQEEELDVVLSVSRKLSVRPVIGVRAKLRTKHGGHFGTTSGEKGKFGLTSLEIVGIVRKLQKLGMLDCLQLLHFHIGSQIPSVEILNDGVSEAAYIYCELVKLGAGMKIIDIGGGLGIDYEGTKSSSSDMSVSYSLEEYAAAVVKAVRVACSQKGVNHPIICSESGRALVSHHSLLVFDVVSVHDKKDSVSAAVAGMDLKPLVDDLPEELVGEYKSVMAYTAMGDCHRSQICAEHMKARCLDMFKEGRLGLEQLATVDGMCDLVSSPPAGSPAVCHINLSIFKSIPDYWAIGQLFPVMPIQRLNERPTVRAVLSDLTCDSDGKVDTFISSDDNGTRGLALHSFEDRSEPYYLGMFLGGAYQEALGGLHNLFGVPNVVHVVQSSGPHCFSITRALPGQTSADVLRLMMHEPNMMFNSLKCRIEDSLQQMDDDYDLDSAVSNLNTIASTFNSLPYLSSSSSTSSFFTDDEEESHDHDQDHDTW
jgi:arginine decarboxylase